MCPVERITSDDEHTTATLAMSDVDQSSSEDRRAPYDDNANLQDMSGMLTEGVFSPGRGTFTCQDTVLRVNGISGSQLTIFAWLTLHR
jgi:hypothetical protein